MSHFIAKPTELSTITSMQDRDVNLDETREFLHMMGPNAGFFIFQTFRKDNPSLAKQFTGSFEEHASELGQLNALGAGVSVTINETDGRGRKTENVTRVRAIYGDFDNGLPNEFPLDPSLIVQTSLNGFHAYWLVDDLTFDEHRACEKRIVELGADKAATDLARVFRLPGFFNHKHEPAFLVRTIEGTGTRYTRQQILDAFGPEQPRQPTAPSKSPALADRPRVENALGHIEAKRYEDYIEVGMALHHWSNGCVEGLEIFKKWAMSSSNYDKDDAVSRWKSFSDTKGRTVTIATIFHIAAENGWSEPVVAWPVVSKDGVPKRSQRNILAAAHHLGVKLRFDEFANRYQMFKSGKWVDFDDAVTDWFYLAVDHLGLQVPLDYVRRTLRNECRKNAFHPVKDYLASLTWDGIHRLDTLLSAYANADDTELNRAYIRKTLIGAVMRVMEPGCKHDSLLVFEGKQAVGKSRLVRALAKWWFGDAVNRRAILTPVEG